MRVKNLVITKVYYLLLVSYLFLYIISICIFTYTNIYIRIYTYIFNILYIINNRFSTYLKFTKIALKHIRLISYFMITKWREIIYVSCYKSYNKYIIVKDKKRFLG